MKFENRLPRFRFWTSITVAIIMLTVLMPSLYGCGTKCEFLVSQMVKATEGATISSSDQKITLEIPPDSLKEDTIITLSIVPEEEWADDVRAVEPLGPVYRLEPDGIEFNEPVNITITLELDDIAGLGLPEGVFPACIPITRSNGGELDVLRNPKTTIDIDTGEVLITGETSHFSDAVVTNGYLAAFIKPSSVQADLNDVWRATVTLFNLGDVEAEIYKVAYISDDKCVYTHSHPYGHSFTLAAGDSRTLDLVAGVPNYECLRKGTGKYGASINAMQSGAWWPPDTFLSIEVWGSAVCGGTIGTSGPEPAHAPKEGKEYCELTFSPDYLHFDDVCIGGSKTKKITVTNNCSYDINIVGHEWPNPPYRVTSTVQNLTLAPGQSTDYAFIFTPTEDEFYNEQFGVSFYYIYLGEERNEVSRTSLFGYGEKCQQLEGPSHAPEKPVSPKDFQLSFNPTPLDFKDVCVGTTKILKVTVTNNGDFDSDDVKVNVWAEGPFRMVSGEHDIPLNEGESREYFFEFTPYKTGAHNGYFNIGIEYEDNGEYEYKLISLELLGNGVACEQEDTAVSEGAPEETEEVSEESEATTHDSSELPLPEDTEEQASVLWGDGSWNCTSTETGSQIDFQVSVIDLTDGQVPIVAVTLYIDGEEAHSSGAISATEYPINYSIITSPGPHAIRVVVIDDNGQEAEKWWEVYCEEVPTE